MNRDKTECVWVEINKHSSYKTLGIKWSTVIKLLDISYNKDTTLKLNFDDRVLKINNKMNMWKNEILL